MTQASTKQITGLARAYGRHRNLSHWRVSFLMRGNGKFLKKLEEGSTCTIETHKKCIDWMASNWPEDLEWPSEILRPPSKKADAA